MLKQFVNSYLGALHRVFDLPELVVIKISSTDDILYLYDPDEDTWVEDCDDACLFSDIENVRQRYFDFDQNKHLVISYLDEWCEASIKQEIKHGS